MDAAVSCIRMPARLHILCVLVGFSALWMGPEGRFVVVYPWLQFIGLPLAWSWILGFVAIPQLVNRFSGFVPRIGPRECEARALLTRFT